MPNWKTHFAMSKIRTGKSFENLHKWIDENKEDRGINHRSEKHYYTNDLKNYVSITFGGAEAVSEWLFHIALDNLDTSVSNDWNFANKDRNFYKFGFCNDGYIFYSEDELNDDELDDEFSEEYYDDED